MQAGLIAQPGTVIDLTVCTFYGVQPTGVLKYLMRFPSLFRHAGDLRVELLGGAGCTEASAWRITRRGHNRISVKRLVVFLAHDMWPRTARPGLGECSCGSTKLFSECCRKMCVNICKNNKCINPTHINLVPTQKQDAEKTRRSLTRVSELDILINRLTPPQLARLASMHTKSQRRMMDTARVYLAPILGKMVTCTVACDIVIYAHSHKQQCDYESTPAQDDAVDGIRHADRRYVNAGVALTTKDVIYQHAQEVARHIKGGTAVNLASFVRDLNATGNVSVNEGTFRYAVKKIIDDEGSYSKDKERHTINAKAKASAIQHPTLNARQVYALIDEEVRASGCVKRNVMNVIRRAIKHRDHLTRS